MFFNDGIEAKLDVELGAGLDGFPILINECY